jgi:hypothetical protein
MPYFVYPLIVLGALLLLFAAIALLARIQGGRFLRPVVTTMAKVPLIRRLMTKASAAAMERQNPELASAMRKLEGVSPNMPPQQAQRLLARLTPAERAAYFELMGQQAAQPDAPINRTDRRRLERQQPTARKRGGGGGKRKRR